MDDVPQELADFSTSGDSGSLYNVFLLQHILDGFLVDFIQDSPITSGAGSTVSEIVVDKYHPLVSVIARQDPSPDFVAGVADLVLCDGASWRESVKVCLELFSTAAGSEREAPEMERNSVQGDNCSYGYIELTMQETQVSIHLTKILSRKIIASHFTF